mgnify:CR=1 FL=1
MSEEILMNITPMESRVAVVENGVLQEVHVERTQKRGIVGNIYKGKVQRVMPGMQAAFVDIGRGRNGVLYAGEVNWDAVGLSGKQRSIEQALKSGDKVLVQVTKDPIGHKGARLTSQVSLPGRSTTTRRTACALSSSRYASVARWATNARHRQSA